jgi:hypothetical protein
LPDLHLRKSGEDRPHHYIFGNYSIPIDRKLSGFVNTFGKSGFDFDIKDLEGLKQGQILLDVRDFEDSLLLVLLDRDRTSNLTRTDILIGNEEVEKFLKEKRIENYQEILNILEHPGFTRGRIEQYYDKQREELGRNVVITSYEIANAFRKVQELENSVMCAHFGWDFDARGRCWSAGGNVGRYLGLREQISNKIKILNEYLKEGKENPKLYAFTNDPLIDGEIIGFPEKTAFSSYYNWITDSFIPDINSTLEKLDSHLREERQKTYSS